MIKELTDLQRLRGADVLASPRRLAPRPLALRSEPSHLPQCTSFPQFTHFAPAPSARSTKPYTRKSAHEAFPARRRANSRAVLHLQRVRMCRVRASQRRSRCALGRGDAHVSRWRTYTPNPRPKISAHSRILKASEIRR